MYNTHGVDKLLLGFFGADNIKVLEEVVRHSNQGVFRPPTEPVHRTARYQTRKLQRSVSELFSNLQKKQNKENFAAVKCNLIFLPQEYI